jgi:hypothetical protein
MGGVRRTAASSAVSNQARGPQKHAGFETSVKLSNEKTSENRGFQRFPYGFFKI